MPDNNSKNLPATADSVTAVIFDDHHEGVTGASLADAGRPTTFKLDHKKGKYYPLDDDEERYESLDVVIVNARLAYRKFGNNGPACSSDDGKTGYDVEKKTHVQCDACPFFYGLENFQGQGQCSLGLTMQAVACIDGKSLPIVMNLSQSSARGFTQYLKKLERKGLKIREVTTKLASRYINGKMMSYYAAEFKLPDDHKPVVDITPYLPKAV